MAILGGILGGLIKPVSDILDKVIVDKDARNQAKVDLQKVVLEFEDKAEQRLHEQMLAQVEVNKVEAGSSNLFVAGWRPAVGWLGAAGFGYSFIVAPMASWIATVMFEYGGSFPMLETEALMFMLAGMLGFGGLRSWDKRSGVTENDTTERDKIKVVKEVVNVPIIQEIPLQVPPKKKKRNIFDKIEDAIDPPEKTPWQ